MTHRDKHDPKRLLTRILGSTAFSNVSCFRNFHALLLFLTGVGTLFFVAEAVRFLPVTGETLYAESAGILSAQRWASGLPLYEDYRRPPYLVTAFPPLWYGVMAMAAKAGLSSLDSLTFFGRVVSLVSLFSVAALGYLWNRRLGHPVRLALLTPAFYCSFPILVPWAVSARPDFPGLFLSFLALYWAGLRSTAPAVFVAGIVAALAFLTRHNAVAVPVVLVLWLLWSHRWKSAALFCTAWASVVGSTLVAFQLHSHGLLLLNLSGAKFGHFALTYIRDILNRLLVTPGYGFAVALFALGLFGFLQSWNRKDERVRLLNVYLVVSFALAVAGSAAANANVNHYLESALALSLLIPTALDRLREEWRSDSPLASFAMVIILVLLLPSLDVQRWNVMHEKPEDLRRVVPLVEKRRVFTDIPYLAARTAMPQLVDMASLINTERVGGWAGWSSATLVEALREKSFELIVLSQPVDMLYIPAGRYPRWPRVDAAIQTTIAQNYDLCFELDSRYVYRPLSTDRHSSGDGCPSLEGISANVHPQSLARPAGTTAGARAVPIQHLGAFARLPLLGRARAQGS